jgi:double-strand break repair protein MRE11
VDTVKVDTLVQEFFAQQSLKILPQAPFGDAVNQFVSKDDKHAVEMFVMDSLSSQVKGLLQLDDDKITEGLDAHIDDFRKVMEKSFVSGQQKQAQRKRRFKEKPEGWDSDLDGHWTAQAGAIEEVPPSPEPANGRGHGRARPTSGVAFSDGDEELPQDEPSAPKAPAKRAAAKTTRTTKKTAPAKKAAAPKKAPARGRRKPNPFQDSEEEDEEEEDVIMEDDDVEPEPPASAAPARSTRSRGGAAKTRQSTLNFSQSQKPKASQKAIEISDDEISEDDAFESMPATRSRRR